MSTRTVTAILLAGGLTLAAAAQTVDTVTSDGLTEPYGVAVDLSTNLYYFSDSANHRLLRYNPADQELRVLAGLEAGLFAPHAIALARGGLVVAESGSHVIRFVGLDGSTSLLAGAAGEPGSADGPAHSARFHAPSGVALGPDGTLWIADSKNSLVRRIAPNNTVSTVSGPFNEPAGIAAAPDGRVFVADTRNHVIRLIARDGSIDLIAGRLGQSGSEDGAGSAARFDRPRGLLWVGGETGLLVADSGNNILRKVVDRGGLWRVETFAGKASTVGSRVDGPLATARFFSPIGLAIDAEGAVIIADLYNNALRRINRKVPPAPVMLPAGGAFSNSVTLTITSAIPATVFRYTTNGLPVSPLSPITGENLTLAGGPVPLQLRGYSVDFATSPLVSNRFEFFVNPLVASAGSGVYTNAIDLAFVSETENIVLRYSTGAVPPNTNSPIWVNGLFEQTGPLQVRAFRHGFTPSPVLSNSFSFVVAPPEIDPPGANADQPVQVTLRTATRDAKIYWTLDNTQPSPSNGFLYEGPLSLATNGFLRAKAYRDSFQPSADVGAQFALTVGDPAVLPSGATDNKPVQIEFVSPTPETRFHWTINGGNPTTNDLLYAGPFLLKTNGTLRVRGFRAGFNPSTVVTNTFSLAVSPLTASIPSGTFENDVFLSAGSPTPGAVIRYVTSGTETPSAFSAVWTDRVLGSTTTLQLQGFLDGLMPSPVLSNRYEFIIAPLKVKQAGGTFLNPVQVPVSSLTSNVDLYYTTDGTPPDPRSARMAAQPSASSGTEGSLFFSSNTLSDRIILKVQGYRDGYQATPVVTTEYVLKAGLPALVASSYSSNAPVLLSLESATEGAQIFWNVNADHPPTTSDNLYTGPFPLRTNGVFQARAFRDGFTPSEVVRQEFRLTVSPLTVDLAAGTYANVARIRVATASPGASLRFTTDGTPPTVNSPILSTDTVRPGEGTAGYYDMASNDPVLSDRLVFQAQAFRDGLVPTAVVSREYRLVAGRPVITASATTGNGPIQVSLATETAEARLYWAVNREATTNDVLYTGPFLHRTNGVLQVRAFRQGFEPSASASQTFGLAVSPLQLAEQPRSSAVVGSGGVFYDSIQIRLASASSNVSFYYTTDGFTPPSPAIAGSLAPSRPDLVRPIEGEQSVSLLNLSQNDSYLSNRLAQFRVQGFLDGLTPTPIVSRTYRFEVGPLRTVNGPGGTYNNPVEVRLSTITTNGAFRYTLADPAADQALIDQGFTVNRDPVTAPEALSMPLSPPRGDEGTAAVLTLSSNTASGSLRLRVAGVRDGFNPSATLTHDYRFVVATPVIEATGLSGSEAVQVSLSTLTRDARIYWAVGRAPTTNDHLYQGPFLHTQTGTLQVRAYRDGFTPSEIAASSFDLRVATPVVTPAGVTTNDAVLVSIVCTTSNAVVRWTLNGPEPGPDSGTVYQGPFLLATNGLMQVRAFRDGFTPSEVVNHAFNLTVAEPTVQPAAARAFNELVVAITPAHSSDIVRFTRDGSTPTGSSEIYSTPLNLRTNTLLAVRGDRAGFVSSAVRLYEYQIQVDTPTMSPASGYFPDGALVTLGVSRPDAVIYYTLNGSLPTTNDFRYTGPFRISQFDVSAPDLRVVKARAFAPDTVPSEVVSGQFAGANSVGIPREVNYTGGVGSTVLVPVVVVLETNLTLRSLQFRVEVAPEDANTPNLTADLRPIPPNPTDFIPLRSPGGGDQVSLLSGSTYRSPNPAAAGQTITNGLVITALGTNANLTIREFDTVVLVAVPIPTTARVGQAYRISVVNPSGTTDGLQGALALQPFPSQRIVVTNVSYLVGDASPGRWYNAGDFGDSVLDNADVNVALAASLGVSAPFAFTDAFDALDAYPEDEPGMVGGDGEIRYLDWQVILRRSLGLDTSRWYRSWTTNGMRGSSPSAQIPRSSAATPALFFTSEGAWIREATLGAGPVHGVKAGEVVHVPVYARVAAGKSLSGLQFRARIQNRTATVAPATRFVPSLGLPRPLTLARQPAHEVVAAWALDLNAFTPALEGSNVIGHLQFTVPAHTPEGEEFLVQFLGVDGAPDAVTAYQLESVSSVVTVGNSAADVTALISDQWIHTYFGAGNPAQSRPDADPDQDGLLNWQEYLLGSHPLDPHSGLRLLSPQVTAEGGAVVLRWPTVEGQRYVIESTSNPALGPWTGAGQTTLGAGGVHEWRESLAAEGAKFYRLRLAP